jgi:hypothetical protein
VHRSLHIVDIENLAGPGHADLKAVTHASAASTTAAYWRTLFVHHFQSLQGTERQP